MRFGVPWSVKGVRPEARETAREAARRSGMSLGEWLNAVIIEQAEEHGLHPGHDRDDHEAYSQDLASVHQRLDEITRRLTQFSRPGPEAYAPKHSRTEEPDRIAELIARLDQRIEQLVAAARPVAMPMAYAPASPAPQVLASPPPPQAAPYVPSPPPGRPMQPLPPVPPVPNVQLPPALDRAIAEIAARQHALNGSPASPRPPQARQHTMAPPPSAAAPQPAPAAPAFAAPPQATPAAPTFAPIPAQNLAGLEEQLRRITDQIETLRRPGVEEAISALRAELKEIARALDDALPRRALDGIERQIQELSQRIAEGRQNGADSGALAGLEHGLAEVRDALRDLTPAENLVGFHDAVDALAHKIDLIVAQRDPATLSQLEHAITTLREMAAHVASDEALRRLAAQVENLSEKVEQMSLSGPANDALAHLEQRIDALGRALAERAQNGTVVPPRLEALVQSLADKIEQIQQSRSDSLVAGHLEDRIVHLVERLDASDARLNHLEAIERGLGDLLVNIQDMRAARDAEARRAQNQPGIDALQHDIARTQTALDEVHGTLGLVVDRLASIEKDIRAESRRRTASDEDAIELTQPVGRLAVRAVSDAPTLAPTAPAPMPAPAPSPPRPPMEPAMAPPVAAPAAPPFAPPVSPPIAAPAPTPA
ncbi:MAG TPA: hypothetical protein VG986_19880, partial [Pseudolabrys sp.]|nr:hypothetical protein [Pseudolabrys sp.]